MARPSCLPRGAYATPLALVAALVAVHAQTPEPFRAPADRPVDVKHIRLDLKVDLPNKTVDGLATLSLEALRKVTSLSLDAVEFEVKKVTLGNGDDAGGTPVPFSHDGKTLELDLDPAWPTHHAATLRIEYRVRDPRSGLHFFHPTPAEPDLPSTVWSQGEPIANRYWFPSFDHPGEKQSTELVVTAADGFEVLSNGKLEGKKANGDGTVTWHWHQPQPHVSYLVTLVVGKFDVVKEEWRGKEVSYYVPVGHKADVGRSFGRTREMLDVFSRRFGIDYPWEKYAQVVVEQFTAGGMENTTATTLNDYALLDERAVLDGDADGLISHELAHQWWGDLVTCKDWAHLWLNEGFASFAEVVWDEHRFGADGGALELHGKKRGALSGGKQRPIVDRRYPSPDSMFDSRAYPKGAWVLHMLRKQLGDDVFWRGVRTYGNEHRYKSVETSDFRKVMERVSGRSLERFFYDWTERAGHPVLSVTPTYLADTKQLRVVVKQTQAGEAFQFPLPIFVQSVRTSKPASPPKSEVKEADAEPTDVEARRIKELVKGVEARVAEMHRTITSSQVQTAVQVTEKEQVFFLNVFDRPELVLIDPDLTVLCEMTEDKGRSLWAAQLRDAPTVASRLAAAAHFGKSKRPEDREALAAALQAEKVWGVQVEVAKALGQSGGDASRDALIAGLKLPDARVRKACLEALGSFRKDAAATAALKAKLREGDASLAVEGESIDAYAAVQPPDLVPVLLPFLAKPSRNDVLRVAAVRGLGASQDLSALDPLLSSAAKGKPYRVRVAALNALSQLAKTGNPADEQRKRIVTAVAAALENEARRVRMAAVGALRSLGQSAAVSQPALEAIARHDPDGRVQELAKKAVEAIQSNTPAPVELTRLRDELDRVRKANEALQERLDRFERKSKRD